MTQHSTAGDRRSSVFFMVLSAGIFAYFGFGGSWAHQYTSASSPTPNTLLPMVALLKWALRGGAIAMAAAAMLTWVGLSAGPLLYAIVGLATAVIFVVVGVWELTNAQGYYSGVPAILLFIFAAWNGFGSLAGLRDALAGGRAA